jgi:hypothetical protein
MAGKARVGIALILIMLVVGVVSVVRKVSATNVDPVLHLRVATMLISPSGQVATAGSEEVWADWRAGSALSRSVVPGEMAQSERWYRHTGGRTQIWSLQVDGSVISDHGQSPWADVVLSRAAGGLRGLRARYSALMRGTAHMLRLGPHVVRINADGDLLPMPLPGAMMQRGTAVWLDTRSGLPLMVSRSLLPYFGGSAETEICRVDVLDEVSGSNLPRDFAGPPAPMPWDRFIDLAAPALRHVHL